MAKPNAFLAKQQALQQRCFEVACDTTSQQFFDYLCLVLNDPEVMGKNTFGANRIKKIHEALKAVDRQYNEAWVGSQESDYYQEKLDTRLREIFGEIVPFEKRYPYLKTWDYSKPMKERKLK